MVTRKMIVDFMKQSKTNSLEIKQGNESSVSVDFVLMYNGAAFDMSDVALCTVKGIAPNGAIIYVDAELTEDDDGNYTNVVNFLFPESMAGQVGQYTYELMLMDSTSYLLVSFDFYVYVRPQLYSEDTLYTDDDITGVRAYLAKALLAAKRAESVESSFEIAYGSVSTIISALQAELAEYVSYLEELQNKVDSGYFTGPRGAQGENGADAVVTEAGWLYGCQIVDGNLYVYYSDSESAPPLYINDDGDLCVDVEEAD